MPELDYVDCERIVRQALRERDAELGRLLLALVRWLRPAPRPHSGARLAH